MINEEQVLAQIEDLRGRIDTIIGELADVLDEIDATEKLIAPTQKEESRE